MQLHPHCPCVLSDLGEVQYTNLLLLWAMAEFRENRWSEKPYFKQHKWIFALLSTFFALSDKIGHSRCWQEASFVRSARWEPNWQLRGPKSNDTPEPWRDTLRDLDSKERLGKSECAMRSQRPTDHGAPSPLPTHYGTLFTKILLSAWIVWMSSQHIRVATRTLQWSVCLSA